MNPRHLEFLQHCLDKANLTALQPPTLFRDRPWSCIWTIETNAGRLFLKEQRAALANEASLLPFLSSHCADNLPEWLGCLPEAGLVLMHDAGRQLREELTECPSLEHWEQVLDIYADIQRRLIGSEETLIALGAQDRRFASLPIQFEALIPILPWLRRKSEDGLTDSEILLLPKALELLKSQCQYLTESVLPETINHDDLHSGNIFLKEERYRLIDWGDCVVSHPFFTIPITLMSAADSLGCLDDAPEIAALRDRYLLHWAEFASLEVLQQIYRMVECANPINRVLTWYAANKHLPDAAESDGMKSLLIWLREYLVMVQAS